MQEVKEGTLFLYDPGTDGSSGHEFPCTVESIADNGNLVLLPGEEWQGDSHFYQDRFRWMIEAAQQDDKDGPGLEGPDLEEWAATWIENQVALLANALWDVYSKELDLEDPATIAAKRQAILNRIQG